MAAATTITAQFHPMLMTPEVDVGLDVATGASVGAVTDMKVGEGVVDEFVGAPVEAGGGATGAATGEAEGGATGAATGAATGGATGVDIA